MQIGVAPIPPCQPKDDDQRRMHIHQAVRDYILCKLLSSMPNLLSITDSSGLTVGRDSPNCQMSHAVGKLLCMRKTKVGAILRTIGKHAHIHVCLAVIFAFSWFFHNIAYMRMEMCNRQFSVMNDRTMRTMALIDYLAANSWLAMAYAFLAFAAVVFLQIRARPSWTCWLTAAMFCAPCIVYWDACAYIAVGKFP